MPAPKGNKHNQKPHNNYDNAFNFLTESLEKLKKDKNILTLYSLAELMDTYPDRYEYLVKKFEAENIEFRTIKKKIDTILGNRLLDGGLKNNLNSTMAIFLAKCLLGLKENKEIENTEKVININFGVHPE